MEEVERSSRPTCGPTLENALDEFRLARAPAVAEANRRGQIVALTGVDDERLGHDNGDLWATLSRAAHHHAYELAPPSAQLRVAQSRTSTTTSPSTTIGPLGETGGKVRRA
ncbi:MAG: hypothetical protein ABS80_08100 [Pseudonocardia sp. SCN 72-51]|nr:MAG: hypothetical protein ABS80_08100 [Pseudonocardia sp. SCN 72-51]